MSGTETSMLDHALRYARRGWPVFPCWERNETEAEFQARLTRMPAEKRNAAKQWEAKNPRVAGGLKAATTDEAQIKRWWRQWPDAAIGVPAGPTTGWFVLDVDMPAGPASIASLEAANSPLPATVTAETPSGGKHLLFKYPDDGTVIKNRARRYGQDFFDGLDVRGDGGYVCVAPSRLAGRGAYVWTSNGTPLAEAPQWLIRLAAKTPQKAEKNPLDCKTNKAMPQAETTPQRRSGAITDARAKSYGETAIIEEIDRLNSTPEGERNETLNRVAFRLGQLVAGGCLDQCEVERALAGAAANIGLPNGETMKTIASGINAGMREPRGPKDTTKTACAAKSQGDGKALVPTTGEVIDVAQAVEREQRGCADLYVALRRGRRIFDHAEARWYSFNGVAWEPDECGGALRDVELVAELVHAEAIRRGKLLAEIMSKDGGNKDAIKKAMDYLRQAVTRTKELRKRPYIADVLKLAADGKDALATSGQEWDQHRHLLPVANGVLDLRTGELAPGQPENMLRAQSPATWKGLDAPCPTWDAFLADIFDGDVEMLDYIQALLGYGITGFTNEQVFPVLVGKGRNGKGTMLQAVASILGNRLAAPSPSEILLLQDKAKAASAPSPEILALYGRRLSWCSETENDRRFNAARLKLLTGQDDLVGRPPYGKAEVTFRPTHKLLLLTNFPPAADSEDFAFWDRVRLIEFRKSYVAEPDPDDPDQRPKDNALPDKLATEASGILAWLVRGAMRWFKEGLKTPASVKEATKALRGETDHLDEFLAECCETGMSDHHAVTSAYLFAAYRTWCVKLQALPMQQTTFGVKMKKKFTKTKDRRYTGVTLTDEWLRIVSNNR